MTKFRHILHWTAVLALLIHLSLPSTAVGQELPLDEDGPIPMDDLSLPVDVASGTAHSCALMDNGTVKCWGKNTHGQLGNATNIDSMTPVTVTGVTNAVDIASGAEHSCALDRDGHAKCWGNNLYGPLGNGSELSSNVPVNVRNLSNGRSIEAGGQTTCAVNHGGAVKCWGRSYDINDIYDHTDDEELTPKLIEDATNVIKVAVGSDAQGFCALLSTGNVKCWTSFSPNSPNGELVPEITNAVDLRFGDGHTCIINNSGRVKCWGVGTDGQLGNGFDRDSVPSFIETDIPVLVNGISNAVSLTLGDSHSCISNGAGIIKCWGGNQYGQLGNGTNTQSLAPLPVFGISNIVKLGKSSQSDTSCAIDINNYVYCWGQSIFAPDYINSNVPVRVIGFSNTVY